MSNDTTEIERALQQEVQKITQQKVAETTNKLCEAIKANAPVKTGKLRDSIKAEVAGNVGMITTDVDYALYLEYGTTKMAAHPFIQPAVERVKRELDTHE